MISGVINVYKEKGYTSHDVVAKLRGILKQKKIGHTGTLDPDAEGVLPVCLGKATKLCDMLTDKDKTYKTVMQLGITTDTEDMTGTVLQEKPVTADAAMIKQAVLSFAGEYMQVPPMYSALKVNGRKLYELAREGKTIERKARRVQIHSITDISIDLEKNQVEMTVTCSKGTYIRTLCSDIGEQLGCGACMGALLRTKVSSFQLDESMKLNEITALMEQNRILEFIIPIEDMFSDYRKVQVKEEFCRLIYNGNIFSKEHLADGIDMEENQSVRVYDTSGEFVGIYEYLANESKFRLVKMFR